MSLPRFLNRQQHSARPRLESPTRRKPFRPLMESLEDRTLLTGNLWVTDSYLTDIAGNALGSSAVGARDVFVQTEFRTQGLAANAQYVLRYTLNGQVITSAPINWGAGQPGTGYWVHRWGVWVIGPQAIQSVSVLLDANNQVAETNETDNDRTFLIAPVTFSSIYQTGTRFVTPLGGSPNQDWSIVNYVDLDPSADCDDYLGGNYCYDGHDALDITIANFTAQDKGLPVFAAAAGVVTERRDNQFDRNYCPTICLGTGNYLKIDHGNNWATIYWHERQNSITVSVGDVVKAGDVIGLVGSSGNSSDAHLHFAVYHKGVAVETYKAPASYWVSPLPYSGNVPGVLDFGTTDHAPSTAEYKNRPNERATFPASPLQPVHFWALMHGISAGTPMSVVWKRPGGAVYSTDSWNSGQVRYGWVTQSVSLPVIPQSGLWTVELRRNGILMAQDEFRVSNAQADQAGEIEFNTNSYTVTEHGVSAEVTVTRTSPTGTVSVQYTTLSSTATPGSDYTTTSGTLTFNPGQLVRTFNVPILNNSLYEPKERFLLMLSNPTGGATLGIQWLSGVDIIDNDFLLNYSAATDTLTVWGDTQQVHDDITLDVVGAFFRINVNGNINLFPTSQVDAIVINSGDGNDTIDIEETLAGKPVTINAGDDNDWVRLSTTARNLATIQGNVTANAGLGSDSITVYDTLSAANSDWTLTASSVTRTGAALVSYNSFNTGAFLNGGTGATTFYINGTHAYPTVLNSGTGVNDIYVRATFGPLTLNGQNGLDIVNVGSPLNSLQQIQGAVHLTNSGSYTALSITGTGDIAPAAATLNALSLTGLSPAPISWTQNDLRSLTIRGGSGGNTFNITGTPQNAYPVSTFLGSGPGNDTVFVRATSGPLTVSAGSGNDVINVGGPGNTLDNILGALTVGGNDHTTEDVLNLNDQGSFANRTYAVTATTVQRNGAAQITYGTVERLVLNAGTGHDTIAVQGTAATTPLTVNAGGGNDTISVGNIANSLDALLSSVTLDAGTGADAVSLNDQATATARSYGLNSGLVSFLAVVLNHNNLEALTLNATAFDDLVNVSGNTAGMTATLNAGGGADTLTGGNAVNLFVVTGLDAGTMNQTNTFNSFENLLGSIGTDTYRFANDLAVVSGWVDGDAGADWLDYSPLASGIYAILFIGVVSGVGVSSANVENVIGSAGSDFITGDAAANVLIGGPSADWVEGREGRDIVIGGTGGDLVFGDSGFETLPDDEDILIGGGTPYDGNVTALNAIMAVWSGPGAYAVRVAQLADAAFAHPLNPTTLVGDGEADLLTGGQGLDWFLVDGLDGILDWENNEEVTFVV